MRILTMQIHLEGETDKSDSVRVIFKREEQAEFSLNEVVKGVAFGVAMLYRSHCADMDEEEFVKAFSETIRESIGACVTPPTEITLH